MTDKELNRFLRETKNAPYFSTLYDLDMWKDDKEKLELNLKMVEFIKSHFKIEITATYGIKTFTLSFHNDKGVVNFAAVLLTPEEFEILKNWNWKENEDA